MPSPEPGCISDNRAITKRSDGPYARAVALRIFQAACDESREATRAIDECVITACRPHGSRHSDGPRTSRL